MTLMPRSSVAADTVLEIHVQGPDAGAVSDADLRRLFPGAALTERRLERLRDWPTVTVSCRNRIVALATCKKTETELRVPDLAIDADAPCDSHDVLVALLEAVELAGLAGGCARIVIMPPRQSPSVLERRGYAAIRERCAGGWLEKTLG
jgi:hypothetical protein